MRAIVEKARDLSVGELMDLAESILPLITHNIEEGDVADLLMKLPEYIDYDLCMDRVPYDYHYSNLGEMLVPEQWYTNNVLHEWIFSPEPVEHETEEESTEYEEESTGYEDESEEESAEILLENF